MSNRPPFKKSPIHEENNTYVLRTERSYPMLEIERGEPARALSLSLCVCGYAAGIPTSV